MSDNLMLLLKTEMRNRFRLNSITREKDRKKRARTIGVAVAFLMLVILFAGYSFGLSYAFGTLGMADVVPGYALTITSIATLVFTFFKTNGVLFGTRDYDMLMALPIRTETMITAKFLSMYLNNLAFAVVVMIPMMVGYAIYHPLNTPAVIGWILGILVAPFFPMTIAVVFGTIIIGIGSGFKHKILIQAILTIAVVVGVFAVSFVLQKTAAEDPARLSSMFADLGAAISALLHRIYPLSAWFDEAVNHQKLLALFVLLMVSIGGYAIFVLVCGKYYRKINSSLKSHHTAADYKVGSLKRNSVMSALVFKEWKRFTSSIVYMMNIGMGLILALLISVVSAFAGIDKVIGAMNLGDTNAIKPMLVKLVPFAIAVLVNMCNTSCVSLSLEGQNLWVVKSLPVDRKTVLQGKMLFNIVLVLPVSLFCNVILLFKLPASAQMAFLYLVFAVVSVLLSTVWGTFINVRFPNFSWENEIQVIKQGMSSMIGILSSMIGYSLMLLAAVFLNNKASGEIILLGFTVLTGVLAALLYKKLFII